MVKGIDSKDALAVLELDGKDVYAVLAEANAVRIEHRGFKVNLCGVVNAKSGHCSEDCKFCAQSAHNDAEIKTYALLERDEMTAAAKLAEGQKAHRFGIVTSGLALEDDAEIERVADTIGAIAETCRVSPCASLGNVDRGVLERLKAAGLTRYHCNLETAESFYPQICSTRPWGDAVATIEAAKAVGLATCSGGLFGLGESLAQRIELLAAIRDLDVDSVPLNFYHPIEGTPCASLPPLKPLECLQVVAAARLMMPTKEIRVCGGREYNLRDLQSWVLLSGADGLMVGGYLTTSGRDVDADLKMIADAGFAVEWH